MFSSILIPTILNQIIANQIIGNKPNNQSSNNQIQNKPKLIFPRQLPAIFTTKFQPKLSQPKLNQNLILSPTRTLKLNTNRTKQPNQNLTTLLTLHRNIRSIIYRSRNNQIMTITTLILINRQTNHSPSLV